MWLAMYTAVPASANHFPPRAGVARDEGRSGAPDRRAIHADLLALALGGVAGPEGQGATAAHDHQLEELVPPPPGRGVIREASHAPPVHGHQDVARTHARAVGRAARLHAEDRDST